MEFLRSIIALNRDVIYFAYGLVFFILGLAIALQSRSSSRLDLARSLKWLAAFGFVHGFYEWGDLFIPIQSAYLAESTIRILNEIHLLFLAISFTLMFEFGAALLKPFEQARWLHGFSLALLGAWIVLVYWPLLRVFPDSEAWHSAANAFARYFIGFPGGMLAAYSLRRHTLERIVPLRVPHIARMLQVAGVMLAIYALLGGLIPPPVPFFPGNWLNSQTVEQYLVFPPPVLRSAVGLALVFAIIRALEVFEVEARRMVEAMEQQQILAAERERIGRQLHDGAIQKVYTAGLLVESARKLAGDADQVNERLEKIIKVLNDAIGDLRSSLVELDSSPPEEPFPAALAKLAQDPRFRSMVEVSLSVDLPESEPLSPSRSGHLLAIVNEALSNVVRHARASQVRIAARKQEGRLELLIEDDGMGLPEKFRPGYGLRNMQDRARLLGGRLTLETINGRGTRVRLDAPWKDER